MQPSAHKEHAARQAANGACPTQAVGASVSVAGGLAYNVSGNRGVQLELVNGKSILIGSQRAGELALAIQEGLKRQGRV
jgi:hypothetical protein